MAADFTQDTAVVFTALVEPGRGFARAVERNRALMAVVLSTLLSLVATGLILPRVDQEAVAADKLQPEMTQHEREKAVEAAVRLHRVKSWAIAGVGPVALAFLVTVGLWLGFKVAGARTGFKATFTVAAHALVPQAIHSLLSAPAAIAHAPVTPEQLPKLLPSNLAAVLPASLPPPVLAAASALDIFTLWSLVLLGLGMARCSGASRVRSFAVVVILFLASVALLKIAPAGAPSGP